MSALHEEEFQDKKVDLSMWKKLLQFAVPYRKLIFGVIGCMMFSGSADVLFSQINAWVIDSNIAAGTFVGLWRYMALSCTMLILQASVVFLFIFMAGKVETGITHDIRQQGCKRLQELSFREGQSTSL